MTFSLCLNQVRIKVRHTNMVHSLKNNDSSHEHVSILQVGHSLYNLQKKSVATLVFA